MEPKVSIIIPVYNSEKYLEKCIDSILNQDYKNIELIIINDGSTDSSKEIIENYQKKYNDTIIYIEQKNLGPAVARNNGIKNATGKYIFFIDNDDYIDKNYIATFVKEAESNNYDIIIGGYRRTNEKGKILEEVKYNNTKWCKYKSITPWARIYNREYVVKNKFEFLKCNIGEDIYFNIQAVSISDNVKIIDYIGYNWFLNSQSISNTVHKKFYDLETYKLLESLYNGLKERKILSEEKEYIEIFLFLHIIWTFLNTGKSLSFKQFKQEYNKMFIWLKEKYPNYQKGKLRKILSLNGETFANKFKLLMFMLLHKCKMDTLALYEYLKVKE